MSVSAPFAGQVAVVTGGSRGIGYATAAALLQQGARVAICGQDEDRLHAAVESLGHWGEVAGWPLSVADYSAVLGLVERTAARFGPIDILVNNAARLYVGAFVEQPVESIDEIIDVNLKGALYATRAVLPQMAAVGRGCIINISSSLGTFGMAQLASYCASKFGLVGFTQSLAQEVAAAGVRVYGVTLGMCATDMQEQYSGHRQGMPPDVVAEEIVLLAGPNPPIKSGTCLDVYV